MQTDGDQVNGLRTIEVSELKAEFLTLMEEVAGRSEEIVVTKNGQPVLRLLPYREKPGSPFGRDRDFIRIHGDLDKPVDVEWDTVTGRGFGQ